LKTGIQFLLALALAAPGAARAQGEPAGAVAPGPAAPGELVLRPGDRLRFSVMEDADLAGEAVISGSGKIELPLIGLSVAAGKTVEQVSAEVRQALEADFLVKATVRIMLADRPERSANRGRVFLAGQMRKIGVVDIDLSENNTVGRVVLANGGLADFADGRKIRIIRKSGSGPAVETLVVDLDEVLKKGRIDKDVPIFDGDFVIADAKLVNW
jgi:polysaccharide export outer membrane protein